MNTSSLQAVQALNQTAFDVTFRTLHERKLYAGKLAQLDSIDVRVYGSSETIVTASRIPDEFDDNYVRTWLSRYGQVLVSKMVTYRDKPTIRNGNRQYKMVLKPGVNIPSSWRMADGRLVFFRYVGQVRTCLKCHQEGHEVANCTVSFCNKCQTVGHIAADCTNAIVCNNCHKEGHIARRCPTSYSNKLQLGNTWTRGPEPEAGGSNPPAAGPVQPTPTAPQVPAAGPVQPTPTAPQALTDQSTPEGESLDSSSQVSYDQDSSGAEDAEFSDAQEPQEEGRELFLAATPSSGNQSEGTQSPEGDQRKSSRRSRRRANKRGEGTSGIHRQKSPDAMEVDINRKRSAPSRRSDDDCNPKKKQEVGTETASPSNQDLPLAEDLQIVEPASQQIDEYPSEDSL
ncbi:uncharacterized protein [Branchiostoma lanceolatum]|uniref:uncharacterized protein n=1 Tax=Branchiostoma lanceolatum TaxID=7740 RepID=UPI003456659F